MTDISKIDKALLVWRKRMNAVKAKVFKSPEQSSESVDKERMDVEPTQPNADQPNADQQSASLSFSPQSLMHTMWDVMGELITICLGITLVWFYAINYILAQDQYDVSFLRKLVEQQFSQAFNGANARIETMNFDWYGPDNAFDFSASSISIVDKEGNEIENIAQIRSQFALNEVLSGAFTPRKLYIDGGAVSFQRPLNGNLKMGLGLPDDLGKIQSVFGSQNNQKSAGLSLPQGLKFVELKNGAAFFSDIKNAWDIKLQDVVINYEIGADDSLNLKLDAVTRSENSPPSTVSITAASYDALQTLDLDMDIKGLNLRDNGPKAGPLSALRGLNAPVEIKGSLGIKRSGGLTKMDMGVSTGPGELEIANFNDRFQHFETQVEYDQKTQHIDFTDLVFEAEKFNFKAQGQYHLQQQKLINDKVDQGGAPFNSQALESQSSLETGPPEDVSQDVSRLYNPFRFEFTDIRADVTPVFESALELKEIHLSGGVSIAGKRLKIDPAHFDFGAFSAALKSSLEWGETYADLQMLAGNVQVSGDMRASDLTRLWPVNFGKGARDWIVRSITSGRLENLNCDFDLGEPQFGGANWTSENLKLSFDVSEGNAKYIQTMTPFSQAVGRGLLAGNSFEFWADRGQIGDIEVEKGYVSIPRLFPKGGDIIINVDAKGQLRDLLGLIDQKPFEYVSKYGTDSQAFNGEGKVNLSITRPLLVNFERERIKYASKGEFTNVSAPFSIGPHSLTQGHVTFDIDENGMTVNGPVKIGPWHTDMSWQEIFDQGATPTKYEIKGRLTREDMDRLGVGLRAFIGGDVDVEVLATGVGVNISQASLRADLTPADMVLGSYWSKPKNIAGELKARVKRLEDGSLILENTSVEAPALSLKGNMSLASDFRLIDLRVDDAKIDNLVDGKFTLRPSASGEALSLSVIADYLDISTIMGPLLSGQAAPQTLGLPYKIDGIVTRLLLDEAYVLRDANIVISHNGQGIETAFIDGETRAGNFHASLELDDEGTYRQAVMRVPDASDASFAFFGIDNISGGKMEINAELPPIGLEGTITGKVEVTDFKLLEAPILTQMLSLASLQGLSDVFGGTGLNFDALELPFSWRESKLRLSEARVSGLALGMTASGEVDVGQGQVDISGLLVPAYSANAVLQKIPVLGELLIGKEGEGFFALNYGVKGRFDKSQVSINPLSALTPGVLRRIFQPEEAPQAEGSQTP